MEIKYSTMRYEEILKFASIFNLKTWGKCTHRRTMTILLAASGGGGGGIAGTRAPLGIQILSISCSFQEKLAKSIGGSKGAPGTRPPDPNSFSFMQFSAKICKIIALFVVGAPPGKILDLRLKSSVGVPSGELAPPLRGNPGTATALFN